MVEPKDGGLDVVIVAWKENELQEEVADTGGWGALVAVGRGGRERGEEHPESSGERQDTDVMMVMIPM